MIYGNSIGTEIDRTFIIQDANGNELVATVVDKQVVFDATPNDIRIGKTAATQEGITVGEKEIPSYVTQEGARIILPNNPVRHVSSKYEYTKLQALICAYNTSLANSVATEKVAINGNVYAVQSTSALSSVTSNDTDGAIEFGVTNETDKPQILRYFYYKEIY